PAEAAGRHDEVGATGESIIRVPGINLRNISIMTLLCSLFSEFTMSEQAGPVGDMLPMCCHEVEGMLFIPDGRCTVRRARGGEPTEVAPDGRDFLRPPVGLRHERHKTSDV